MKGFTERALILLSNLGDFEASGSMYKGSYRDAVSNILAYLRSVEIEHDCLITDGLATHLNMQEPRWLATGAQEDLFFMRNYCSVPDYPAVDLPTDLVQKLRHKYPIPRGIDPASRFDIVAKRVKYAERALIDTYSFVVVFGKEFSARPKVGDGRAVLTVNDKKFYTQLTLSGEPVPINDFLQVPYASLCLCDWGKYSGNYYR